MRRLAILWGLGCATSPALAFHDEHPVTDWSAHTLDGGEVRVGPFRAQYGLTDDLQVGTVIPVWAVKVRNFDLKWRAWRRGRWALGVSSGLAWLNARYFGAEQPDVSVFVFPLEGTASWARGALAAHLRLGTSVVRSSGGGGGGTEVDIQGVAAIGTVYAAPVVEWHLSRVTALVAEAHLGLRQELGGKGDVTYRSEDGRSRVDLHAGAASDLSKGTPANLVLSAFWSWEVFQLKAGLGYGQYQVPMLNLFVDSAPFIFPELDLYWRW